MRVHAGIALYVRLSSIGLVMSLCVVKRCMSKSSQASSAAANVAKGEPPTVTAGLSWCRDLHEATYPCLPCGCGPVVLSRLIANAYSLLFACQISKLRSGVATGLK